VDKSEPIYKGNFESESTVSIRTPTPHPWWRQIAFIFKCLTDVITYEQDLLILLIIMIKLW